MKYIPLRNHITSSLLLHNMSDVCGDCDDDGNDYVIDDAITMQYIIHQDKSNFDC